MNSHQHKHTKDMTNGHSCCASSSGEQKLVKDPVCGMTIEPQTAKYKTSYKEHDYYFCAENCLTKFKADPEKYLAPFVTSSALCPQRQSSFACL